LTGKLTLPSTLAQQLSLAAGPVITNVLAQGGVHTSKPSGEVGAVRTMTLDGFDGIAAAWAPIIRSHGYRIDLRAVFCHSSPQVTFKPLPHPNYTSGKNPRQCELADLLIVIDHVDRFKHIDERRAALIQAKILKGGAVKPTGQEWVQHELLAWLPSFKFVDHAYDPRIRDLIQTPSVGLVAQTAEYGGLDLSSSTPIWSHELTQTSAPWFHSRIALNNYLACMATGDPSCGRKAVIGGADDWSFTVDELLRVTAARSITSGCSVARGNDNVIGFIADTSSMVGGDDGGVDYADRPSEEWPKGPISTVHMTLSTLND
jgi:hypothetical protein